MSTDIAIRADELTGRLLRPYAEMSNDDKALLKQACSSSNLNDQQFALLVEVARRSGLDPFRKHLYGLFFQGKFTLVTGIDGFRAVARRHGLAGIDDAIHTYDEKNKESQAYPKTATVTVYRRGPTGEREPYTATARWSEYRRLQKDGSLMSNWKSMPHIMLDKCAEALALRKAFTESLGGIYERAEFGHADGAAAERATKAPTKLADIMQQEPKEPRIVAKRPEGSDPIDVEWHEGDAGEPPAGEGYIPPEDDS
jgi:phage recombination protein Bet